MSHGHGAFYGAYKGIVEGPTKRATRLHVRSFDHGSHGKALRTP